MAVAANVSVCPMCGGSVGAGDQACPHCRATSQWQDYARAIAFCREEFSGWCIRGLIGEPQYRAKDRQLAAAASAFGGGGARRPRLSARRRSGVSVNLLAVQTTHRRILFFLQQLRRAAWPGGRHVAIFGLPVEADCQLRSAGINADPNARMHLRCAGSCRCASDGIGARPTERGCTGRSAVVVFAWFEERWNRRCRSGAAAGRAADS